VFIHRAPDDGAYHVQATTDTGEAAERPARIRLAAALATREWVQKAAMQCSIHDFGLFVQDPVQQRTVDLDLAIIVDEPQLAELCS
jgi:hypothetical protein